MFKQITWCHWLPLYHCHRCLYRGGCVEHGCLRSPLWTKSIVLDLDYEKELVQSLLQHCRAGVPTLSLTMYTFSFWTDVHVHATKYFIMTNHSCINNKHILIFENNIHWFIYKYLEMNNIQIYLSLLLLILNVPLQIGNCKHRGACTPGWEPLNWRHLAVLKKRTQKLCNGTFGKENWS